MALLRKDEVVLSLTVIAPVLASAGRSATSSTTSTSVAEMLVERRTRKHKNLYIIGAEE